MPQIPKLVVLFAAKRLSIMYKQPGQALRAAWVTS